MAVLSLVNVLVIARALGASGRGAVAFLVAVAVLSGHVGSLGVQEANANIGGAEPELRRTLAANSLVFALVFGAATAAVVGGIVAVAPSVGGGSAPVLLAVALGSLPLVLGKQYLSLLVQSDYGFRITNLAWLAGPATSVAANSAAAALGILSVGSAIGPWAVGQALGFALLVVSVARGAGFGSPQLGVAVRTLRFGLKTHVVRARAAQAARAAARVFRVTLVLATGLALVLAAAAPLLCTIVFGGEFGDSVPQLRVLALSAFGITALELLGNALTAQRKPILKAAATGVAFLTTLALDLVLIPRFGGIGAAIATSAAYSASGVAIAAIFVRSLGARPADLRPRPSDLAWLAGKFRTRMAT